jgi:hypothetical protein
MREIKSALEAAEILRTVSAKVIAVDGAHGSGKSHFARELGAAIGFPVVHLDAFLDRNKGEYARYLDYAALSARLSSLDAVIVEGICALEIFARHGLTADALVYVKRMHRGLWTEENDLDVQLGIEDHLAIVRRRIQPIAEKLGESDDLGLADEVIRYHAAHRPHESASLVFLRDDS